jgi:hypothetical protein
LTQTKNSGRCADEFCFCLVIFNSFVNVQQSGWTQFGAPRTQPSTRAWWRTAVGLAPRGQPSTRGWPRATNQRRRGRGRGQRAPRTQPSARAWRRIVGRLVPRGQPSTGGWRRATSRRARRTQPSAEARLVARAEGRRGHNRRSKRSLGAELGRTEGGIDSESL